MTLTKQTRHKNIGALFVSALLILGSASADEYSDARAELIAAYQAADYPAMLVAAKKTLDARPGYPGALFNLALTQTLNGDHQASLDTLQQLLEKGIDFGAADLDEFAALRELDAWGAYQNKVRALYVARGSADVAATYDEAKFVPEGIAIDKDGAIYLGSIHAGTLVKLGQDPIVLSDRDSHWSVFGMRFDADGNLWFASAAVAQMANVGDDEGQAGLFRYNVESGAIDRTAVLPDSDDAQVLGDLVIADANTIVATDSLTGVVYRYDIKANEFETLVERGKLGSPQGLVLDESGDHLYVADYIGGLFRISMTDGELHKMAIAADVTDYGIDGLYRYGDELIVIQNGVRPHRVAALQLSDDGLAVTGSRLLASNLEQFDEPTLGLVRDDDFYFVANSHWNRFDRENRLPEGLSGPVILKLPLN